MSKIKYLFKYFRAKYRLLYGFCPLCNSDAPELYDCSICEYYSQASGDKYPPNKETKKQWWGDYKEVIDAKLSIDQILAKHRSK